MAVPLVDQRWKERRQNYGDVTKTKREKRKKTTTRRRFALSSNGASQPHLSRLHYSSTAIIYNQWQCQSRCHHHRLITSLLLLSRFPKMLLRGTISAPLPSLRLTSAAAAPPQNVAVSWHSPTNKYSISDQDLDSRGFLLHRTIADLNLDHLNKVFVAVGFPKRDPEKIRIALEHTDSLLWMEYAKTKRPVAFARATGDGVFNAIIWDVVVDPSFQGIGLGRAVMERLVEELVDKGIGNIALYSEPRVLGFYRPLGFVADPDGIRGMVYSRKPKKQK